MPIGDPDDDDGSSSDDSSSGGDGPLPPLWRNPRRRARNEDLMLRSFVQAFQTAARPPAVTTNPVHLNKLSTYNGKDLSKFRSWWLRVTSYMETYAESFP